MTYCLALRLDEGLVFLADTRTNAGVDNVNTYRKLHVLRPAPDRIFVLQSAGNLATTQEVLDLVDRDLAAGDDRVTLATVDHLFEAALYIGGLSTEVVARHRATLSAIGADATATFILGGQIAGERPDLFLVFPEGNYIRVSDERPFLQIGETKYGKFLLDMAVRARLDLTDSVKVALGSMMSTARANLSVGPPYDCAIYRNGSLELTAFRVEATSPLLDRMASLWEERVVALVQDLPDITDGDITLVED